jgi:glycerophosphoryl diester phosphodiesterase
MNRDLPTEAVAAEWADEFGLTWHVVADTTGSWMEKWGGADGTSQHSYTVLDEDGRVTWMRNDGSSESGAVIAEAIDNAFP